MLHKHNTDIEKENVCLWNDQIKQRDLTATEKPKEIKNINLCESNEYKNPLTPR